MNDLCHFSRLNSIPSVNEEKLKNYEDGLKKLHFEFECRFQDFSAIQAELDIFTMPFNVNCEAVRSDLQLELIELQSNNHLKQSFLNMPKLGVLQIIIENFHRTLLLSTWKENGPTSKNIFTAAKQAILRGKGKKRVKKFANSPHNSEAVQKLLADRDQFLRNYAQREDDETRIQINKINADIKRSYIDIKRICWEQLCSKLDYKTPNSRLWKLAKALDRELHH
ncbi:hypothetical protein AVEN_151547-1 [Araneus ventricosus]|uniref:Uncharacterized protein n=1 Tax=Araneus ventricosus TaxID=182803 RepID=A0A4Y2P7Q6_ARAVE|nr:hypothetical protein AVEN_151547-1 [Araneus ventricosus]